MLLSHEKVLQHSQRWIVKDKKTHQSLEALQPIDVGVVVDDNALALRQIGKVLGGAEPQLLAHGVAQTREQLIEHVEAALACVQVADA